MSKHFPAQFCGDTHGIFKSSTVVRSQNSVFLSGGKNQTTAAGVLYDEHEKLGNIMEIDTFKKLEQNSEFVNF